jgi:ammonium transporter Rh
VLIEFSFLFKKNIFMICFSFSAVGYNFLIAAFVLEWALSVRGYMFDFDTVARTFHIDVEKIIVADFVAAAVLISFGAVLGKTNPTQLIIMAFIEVLLQSANEYLGIHRFCAFDIGESMFVHVFGKL